MRYRVPASRHVVEQVVDRSRFRCTVARVMSPAEAQDFVRECQSAYAEATHNCWAFVAGAPGSTTHIGLSDDGEPHGTAGRPMLTVLLHSGVGEIAAVVTRWYGGIKLGTGGLARAYGGAVSLALESLPLAWRVDRVRVAITVEYALITPLRQQLEAFDVELHTEEYAEAVRYELGVARDLVLALEDAVSDLTRGRGMFERLETPVV